MKNTISKILTGVGFFLVMAAGCSVDHNDNLLALLVIGTIGAIMCAIGMKKWQF